MNKYIFFFWGKCMVPSEDRKYLLSLCRKDHCVTVDIRGWIKLHVICKKHATVKAHYGF